MYVKHLILVIYTHILPDDLPFSYRLTPGRGYGQPCEGWRTVATASRDGSRSAVSAALALAAGGRRPNCRRLARWRAVVGRLRAADLRPANRLSVERGRASCWSALIVLRSCARACGTTRHVSRRIRLDAVQLQEDAVQCSAWTRRVDRAKQRRRTPPTSWSSLSRIWLRFMGARRDLVRRDNVEADAARAPEAGQADALRRRIDSGRKLARALSSTSTVPFSERAWQFARGELTLLVTARIRYRDRHLSSRTTVSASSRTLDRFHGRRARF